MRALPKSTIATAAEAAAVAATLAPPKVIIHLSPPPLPSTSAACDSHVHSCRWWPYSNSSDLGANTAMILIVLLCALVCALALNTAIRCFLRAGGGGSNSRRHPPEQRSPQRSQEKTNVEASVAPPLVAPMVIYSAGMKLGGDEVDCAICLLEFEEGEGIRVLGSCKHGFHNHCIERWLSGHSSCPTCRRSCLASSPSSPTSLETANYLSVNIEP